MRVADLVVSFLEDKQIKHVFTVTGGGAMFLNDALYLSKNIKTICNHHEQASAMAAVGYSKYTNNVSSAIFTTGCGATNSITGVLDAWQDNVPCIFISGQVKLKETSRNLKKVKLRQFGVQEADIIEIVKPITKYAVMITKKEDVLFELQKAFFLATSNRMGPVWIDIPLDIQSANVEFKELKTFDIKSFEKKLSNKKNHKVINQLIKDISNSERPIALIGNGLRQSGSIKYFFDFLKIFNIPVVSSYLAKDAISNNLKNYIGTLGIKGDRPGNFAVQNSDLLISFGCRLSVALTGFEYDDFSRGSKKYVIDIDADEHKKNTVKIDKFVHTSLQNFFDYVLNSNCKPYVNHKWLSKCNKWKQMWNINHENHLREQNKINMYDLVHELNNLISNVKASIISDAGSSYYVTSQALFLNKKNRYITSGAQADMGFAIPSSIGVRLAAKKNEYVIAITGEGSFQMNIQELQTIIHHNLNIKIIVLNNGGYLSIKSTQKKFFKGNLIGTDIKSGISFPELKRLCSAYGIKYMSAKNMLSLKKILNNFISYKGPIILEVFNPCDQEVIPTASSKKLDSGKMISKPLEDMYPFLDRNIFMNELIVKPKKEK